MDRHGERCPWVTEDPLYLQYHDEEWGSFEHFFNDAYLLECLSLEIAQAGLRWLTVLHRREAYRALFAGFEPEKLARFTDQDIERLSKDGRIIRHRKKVEAIVANARALLLLQEREGSFASFLWRWAGERRIINHWERAEEVPTYTEESKELSALLKERGFRFVGPVLCYSFMQAVGLVDDHLTTCIVRKRKV